MEHLKKSGGQFSDLDWGAFAEANYDGFWDWHLEEDYEYMSPRFWAILGFEPHEKRHHPSEWQALIHPEDLQAALAAYDLHVQSGGELPYVMEVRYTHKKGHTVTVLCRGRIVEWSEDGRPLRMVGTHTDLTSIERRQEDLRVAKERYDLAVKGAAVGLWDWNIRTGEIFWSSLLLESLGITEENFVPTFSDFADRLHPEDKAAVLEAVDAHLDQKKPYETEFRMRVEHRGWVWFHVRGQAVWNEEGEPTRMAGSLNDITEVKLAERAAEHYLRDLERSNHDLDEFAHIASHDLKEPLRGINSYSHRLLRDYGGVLDEHGRRYLERLIQMSERMDRLVQDLLYFSQIGRSELAMADHSIEDILDGVLETLPLFEEEGVEITINRPLPTIRCHATSIGELFRNLIINAVKYNQSARKRVTIELAGEEDGIPVFRVQDNGIGIPKHHHEDIFRIFKRLNQRDEFGPGTGSGLTFVRKIITRHGGRIWLDSKPGKGTSFMFTLGGRRMDPETDADLNIV